MKPFFILSALLLLNSAVQAQTVTTIKTGMPAPEINLPGLADTTISLSSLKGKVVLIDFWASWCLPCRKNNPELVKVYAELRDKGFEIYGVSIDQKKNDWKDAISKDQLSWPQVVDQKGWYAQSTYDYGLEGIPASFLLDKDGVVRGINLSGKELTRKINALLKN